MLWSSQTVVRLFQLRDHCVSSDFEPVLAGDAPTYTDIHFSPAPSFFRDGVERYVSDSSMGAVRRSFPSERIVGEGRE
jgi:hypothetical protein